MATKTVGSLALVLLVCCLAGVQGVTIRQDQATILRAAVTAWGSFSGSTTWKGAALKDCASYAGITCSIDGYVSSITLVDVGLAGSITAITALSKLSYLDLSGNHALSSDISSISSLTNLVYLNLSDTLNLFDFETSLTSLVKLMTLDISVNRIGGNLPAGISNLKRLRYLNVGDNDFSGPPPATLSLLPALSDLRMNDNMFTGSLSVFTKFTLLTRLELQNNKFTGPIPTVFTNFYYLTHLDLSTNSLSGRLPSAFVNLELLRFLSLADNSFIGQIPRPYIYFPLLETLRLHSNFLDGYLPAFASWPLNEIDVHTNFLTGPVSPKTLLITKSDISANFFFGNPTVTTSTGAVVCNPTELLYNCFGFGATWTNNCGSIPTQRSAANCATFCGTTTTKQCGGRGICFPYNVKDGSTVTYKTKCLCPRGYTVTANNQTCVRNA